MARGRAQLLEVDAVHPEPNRIRKASQLLEAGGVVVVPTDTIYAIVADARSREGIDRLYRSRQLPKKKRLSILARSISEVSRFARFGDDAHRFMRRALPGPYTLILAATKETPKLVLDPDRRQVGVRIPSHAVPHLVMDQLDRPLIATSARVGEEGALSDPRLVAEHFASEVDLVVDAGVLDGTPSTIVDWTEDDPVLVRAGRGPFPLA